MRGQAQLQVGRIDVKARAIHRAKTQPGLFMLGLATGARIALLPKEKQKRKQKKQKKKESDGALPVAVAVSESSCQLTVSPNMTKAFTMMTTIRPKSERKTNRGV